jgi:tryptophan synthase alpha chain
MAGFPDLTTSFELVQIAIEAGADMIELGMPFSDPLADGPTIQKAGQKALQEPFTLRELLLQFGQHIYSVPVVVMTYYNLIYQLGISETVELAKQAGLAGFIVPDLPLEESAVFRSACEKVELDWIPLVAPTSGAIRIKRIDQAATGILYYVSRIGITGAQQNLPVELVTALDELRELTTHPFVVGFGISTPDHAQALRGHTDGIVIASALIDRLLKASPGDYRFIIKDYIGRISSVLG